jgi:hypothetical protein
VLNPTFATLHKWAEALGQKLDVTLSTALLATSSRAMHMPLRGHILR